MKKIFYITAVILLISTAKISAQLGVVAGYDGTAIRGYSYANFKPGFHLGVTCDLKKFSNKWYLQSGLLFTSGGWTFDDHKLTFLDIVDTDIKDYRTSMYMFEIPINFSYRLPVKQHRLRFDIGPYFRYGLFGNVEYKDNDGSQKFDAFEKGAYNRLDIGANVGAGLEIRNKYLINAAYQLSFTNSQKGINAQYMRYRIGLGYLF
jgi:hypothetical protein